MDATESTTIMTTYWNLTEETTNIENITDFLNTTAKPTRPPNSVSKFYPIIIATMALSIICLIFSIRIYSLLPEFKNVHGKNLISLSSCLLTSFTFLILDVLLRNYIPRAFCLTIAAVVQISFLATFFWTNVMAFDIWRSIASMKAKSDVRSHSMKYLKYSLYAWSATVLTSLPAGIIDATEFVPKEYRPKFGQGRCWLNGKTAFEYYFNFPVGVILFSNLVMFFLTLRKLWIIKKCTKILNVKQQQKRLNLYLKLFLIMGITWMTEFLPWVTGVYILYAVAGMLTGLHGVFLFAIFVAKKRILRQFCQLMKCQAAQTPKSSISLPTLTSNSTSKSDSAKEGRFIVYDNLAASVYN